MKSSKHWWLAGAALATLAALALARGARRRADLRGKVALVVGGSRSLGLWIARELAAAGCRLVIAARDQRELDDARRELAASGAQVLAHRCDVGDRDQIQALIAAARGRFGAIDVVVNVAGLIQVGPAQAMTTADFHDALAVNFWGPLHVVDAVVPEMRARRAGRIAIVTSIGGAIPAPHLLPYDCAKAAALALSEGLGIELRKDGVTVTTVVPGLMRTGSAPHARFKGDASAEFRWFDLAASSRVTAMSPARAARRIVDAIARGEPRVVLTLHAKVGRVLHALVPGVAGGVLAAANRLLPSG
jgi:NAD(P)-dependent dehydrogenase (short-subunit alcohol dehydrogenase family)